jgi:MazG family protein
MEQLLDIMRLLRDPQRGCPWDLEQNYQTIVPHTLEEAYEVADSIEKGDLDALQGELGDLLFQVVFYAQLATEEGRFGFKEVVQSINQKLIRRHPHVFADVEVEDARSQTRLWEQLKQAERKSDSSSDDHQPSALDGVLEALPALTRAAKVQRRAAHVGFDWPDHSGVLDKVEEEFAELRVEIEQQQPAAEQVEEEMGDLLFSMVNLCRHLQLDGEGVLRRATTKFERRFRTMEMLLAEQGTHLEQLDQDAMEAAWQQVKQRESV